MKVLMITGDKNFKPGNERYELQKSAVESLAVVYWGRGSLWPALPAGHFEVVTAQDPLWRGVFGLYVANKISARANIQVHMDLEELSWWKYILAKIVLRRADSIRVVSEKIKKQVEKIKGKAKISVLPVFVDVSTFQHVVRRAHEGKPILWVGRFEAEKDPLRAIDVFKEVLQVEPAATLHMLGKGSLGQRMKEKAANLPVEFPGWQDPARFFDTADAVLCTSLHESWGASIVEALAAGVPVVAPDVGIAREAGAIVVPRNKLAQKLVAVLKEGTQGKLLLRISTKEEWIHQWKNTL